MEKTEGARLRWLGGRPRLLAVLFIPVAFFLMLNVHEVGHTVVARLFGDGGAVYYLYGPQPGGGYCVGCNFYDPKVLSLTGNLVVTLGGLIFTQLLVLMLLFGRSSGRYWFSGRLVHILIGVCILDLVFQVFGGLSRNVMYQSALSGTDMADFIYLSVNGIGMGQGTVKLAILVVAMVYLTWIVRALVAKRHRDQGAVVPGQAGGAA